MPLTPGSVTRSDDLTGDEILTLEVPGGALAQGVALVDDSGAQAGVGRNPLAVAEVYASMDVAEAAPLTYVGKLARDGAWLVQRIDETSGMAVRYATVANNALVADYATAWAGRAGLTYGTYAEAL